MGTTVILVYALLVGVGGVIGYTKAGSKISLILGLASATALAVSWWVCQQNPRQGWGLAIAIALLLLLVFAIRYSRTRTFMPAGLLALVSLAASALFSWIAWSQGLGFTAALA